MDTEQDQEITKDDVIDEQEPDIGDEDQPEPDQETEDEDPEEVAVVIGDEDPPEDDDDSEAAPEWVKDLRKKHRQMKRENRELRQKIQKFESPQQVTAYPEPGPRPTLESCDYDEEVFERKYDEWKESKYRIEQNKKAEQERQQKANEAWQQSVNRYVERKQKLRVKDFDDAEEVVLETLNLNQRGMIVQAAESPELVMYALGKNPKKAAELAAINDHVKFAMAIGRLETQLKIKPKNKKSAPPPEKTIRGSGTLAATTDRTLAKLRAEAEKTGDYSKVHRYNRERRRKAG